MTNFLRLRGKHFFNSNDQDELLMRQFFRTLPNKAKDSSPRLDLEQNESVDCLSIMNEVLGGLKEKASNIQVSIVDQLTGARHIERSTLLGKLNRRHVQLIECGRDRALVIPYLNKILLELTGQNWIRAFDVQEIQPCRGIHDAGPARRAANGLLALEYPEEGEPKVNETALTLIREYAAKCELYSQGCREHLMSVMTIKARVDVFGLATTARAVFENNQIMVATLLRETIHDRVMMKSHFQPRTNCSSRWVSRERCILCPLLSQQKERRKELYFVEVWCTVIRIEALQR